MANFVKLPPEIVAFKDKYKLAFDDIWPVPGGKSYAVKHKALERIAVEVGIKFERPEMLEMRLGDKIAAMLVFASLGDHQEWSTGEAAPWNCKNSYTLAMAEKRAKDRCILKLLNIHGDLYSSEELEPTRDNPHVNKPKDIIDAEIEYDDHGEPIDNIPSGEPGIERLPKAKARNDFDAAQKEMHATETIKQLETWAKNNANRIQSFPADWAEMFRGLYAQHRDSLRGKAAA